MTPQGFKAPSDDWSATELTDLYVANHIRLKKLLDDRMQAAGLSLARTKALSQLQQEGPMRQQALAICFGFAPRSITDMVDGLERDGLAERTDDPNDRRAKLVRITPAGERAVRASMAVRAELIEHVFGGLDAADRAEFGRLIRLLDAALLALPDASGGPAEPAGI